MIKFKVGDKVISIKPVGNKDIIGAIGRVVAVTSYDCLVEFDRDIDGHSGNYTNGCANRRGWWCSEDDIEIVKENNMFTKKDLKEFDIVKTRSGGVFMVLRNDMSIDGLSIFNKAHCGCHNHMYSYNDDLTHKGRSADDIVAVKKFDDKHIYRLLDNFFTEGRTQYNWDWERKEVEEMTLEEVCKALGKEIKIVKE